MDLDAPAETTNPADQIDDAGFDRGPEGSPVSSADVPGVAESVPSRESSPAPAPADPNLAASDRRNAAQAQPQDQAAAWRGVREAAQGLGYGFDDDVDSDDKALVHLIQRANTAKKADYYAALGRQLAPHAPKIQEYLGRQQAPEKASDEWDKPEFDPRWASVVERDPATGLYVGKPGVHPDIVDKVNKYANWVERRENDPEGYVSHLASKVFERKFAEQWERQSRQSEQSRAITDIQRTNASWLYQHDDQGKPVFGRDGRPVASPAGTRYLQHVQRVASMGVTDPTHQDQLARQALSNEVYASQLQRSQAAAAQAANPQTQQARTPPNHNPLQTQPALQREGNPAAPPPSQAGMSLRDSLLREMADLKDEDFNVY